MPHGYCWVVVAVQTFPSSPSFLPSFLPFVPFVPYQMSASLPSCCFVCDEVFVGDDFDCNDLEFCSARCLNNYTKCLCRSCECLVCSCDENIPDCYGFENANAVCCDDDDDESVWSDDDGEYEPSDAIILVRYNELLGADEVIVSHYSW